MKAAAAGSIPASVIFPLLKASEASMNIKGLDGREYKLKLSKKIIYQDDARARSSGHMAAREILNRNFTFDEVYEEVFLAGCPTELYLDFFIVRLKLAVEVQGKQHREFTPFYHGNKLGFIEQKKRDASKLEWCNLNGFKLLKWDDDVSPTEWERGLGVFIPIAARINGELS